MGAHSKADVDDLIRATRRYEFADGLAELQLSVVTASIGVVSGVVLSPVFVRSSMVLARTVGSWARWLVMSVLLLPAVVAYGSRHAMRAVRRRWLWRSSGFVEPLPSAVPAGALVLGTAIIVGASVGGSLLYRSGGREPMLVLRVLVASVGWAQGVIIGGVGLRTRLLHYTWVGVGGGLASTVFLFWQLPFGRTFLAFCVLWALVLAASGTTSLRRTLHQSREADRGG